MRHFGAQSHGLHTPCVRFMSGVAPLPCNTRFRLSAHLPDGIGYPQGSSEKFPRFIQSLSNFPGFAWRTQGLTPSFTLRAEILSRRFDDQMIVIRHQHVCTAKYIKPNLILAAAMYSLNLS